MAKKYKTRSIPTTCLPSADSSLDVKCSEEDEIASKALVDVYICVCYLQKFLFRRLI